MEGKIGGERDSEIESQIDGEGREGLRARDIWRERER